MPRRSPGAERQAGGGRRAGDRARGMNADPDPAWTRDLIADDPAPRAAREHHRRALAARVGARQWIHQI
ncbi:hypothetical protein [Phytomonospora endophytica]|uniref:Uncharacterized protein n=1 Tax=Phytomonospora endophytica TaxID=714109 RepID=A0A841FLU4_9ACTN|nr:hypothetical protein [Phytomonospora endophytica]MBB6034157.1 hypothetical protein [Phytomonospora endophytica]GIG66549.1 hypothetical protein Pen01_28440 [Phytomonospora endophytica]